MRPLLTRRAAAALGAAYAVILLLVVLTPIGHQLGALSRDVSLLWTDDLGLPGHPSPVTSGFVLNVVLFVPVGALAVPLLQRPWWVATVACVLLSASIELVQLVPALHRHASLGDVVSNGLGALLGALVYAGLDRARPGRASARRGGTR